MNLSRALYYRYKFYKEFLKNGFNYKGDSYFADEILKDKFGEDVIVGEIGDIVLGRIAGRTEPEEITYFKSVGNAVQDIAVAAKVLSVAEAEELGEIFDL